VGGLNLDTSSNSSRPSRAPYCNSPLGWIQLHCAHGQVAVSPVRCRNCEGCHRARRGKLLARALNVMELHAGGTYGFLTLTSTVGMDWPRMMRAWSQLVKRLRAYSPGLQYMAVKEEGKISGMKHLHVICRGWNYTPWRIISQWWSVFTGARGVDIRRIVGDQERAVQYAIKYVGKAVASLHLRKVATFSSGWGKVVSEGLWRFEKLLRTKPARRMVPTMMGVWVVFRRQIDTYDCDCYGAVVGSQGRRVGAGQVSTRVKRVGKQLALEAVCKAL